MSFKQPISVLVLIYSNQQILLLKRTDGENLWQSVTGSQETGETLLQTAHRELIEETGFQIKINQITDWSVSHYYEIHPRWRHRYAPGITHNQENVFSIHLPEKQIPTLNPREHNEYCWLDFHQAAQKCFSPSNAEMILKLAEKIKQ